MLGMWIGLFLVGCIEDVAKDKAEAVVEEVAAPSEPAAKGPAPAAGEAWKVDVSSSKVRALGAKITATHPIDFKDFEGEVRVEGGKVVGLAYTVQMATLESDHPKLTQHLLNEDFFDVANHPTSSFESSEIAEGAAADGATHTVTGTMTIRGKSMKVTFPATIEASPGAVRARAEFAVDRKDFGIEYPGKKDDLIQDKVVLTVVLNAKES